MIKLAPLQFFCPFGICMLLEALEFSPEFGPVIGMEGDDAQAVTHTRHLLSDMRGYHGSAREELLNPSLDELKISSLQYLKGTEQFTHCTLDENASTSQKNIQAVSRRNHSSTNAASRAREESQNHSSKLSDRHKPPSLSQKFPLPREQSIPERLGDDLDEYLHCSVSHQGEQPPGLELLSWDQIIVDDLDTISRDVHLNAEGSLLSPLGSESSQYALPLHEGTDGCKRRPRESFNSEMGPREKKRLTSFEEEYVVSTEYQAATNLDFVSSMYGSHFANNLPHFQEDILYRYEPVHAKETIPLEENWSLSSGLWEKTQVPQNWYMDSHFPDMSLVPQVKGHNSRSSQHEMSSHKILETQREPKSLFNHYVPTKYANRIESQDGDSSAGTPPYGSDERFIQGDKELEDEKMKDTNCCDNNFPQITTIAYRDASLDQKHSPLTQSAMKNWENHKEFLLKKPDRKFLAWIASLELGKLPIKSKEIFERVYDTEFFDSFSKQKLQSFIKGRKVFQGDVKGIIVRFYKMIEYMWHLNQKILQTLGTRVQEPVFLSEQIDLKNWLTSQIHFLRDSDFFRKKETLVTTLHKGQNGTQLLKVIMDALLFHEQKGSISSPYALIYHQKLIISKEKVLIIEAVVHILGSYYMETNYNKWVQIFENEEKFLISLTAMKKLFSDRTHPFLEDSRIRSLNKLKLLPWKDLLVLDEGKKRHLHYAFQEFYEKKSNLPKLFVELVE